MKIIYKDLEEFKQKKHQEIKLISIADMVETEDGFILKNRYGKTTHDFDGNPVSTITGRKLISPDEVNRSIDEVIKKLFHRLENDKGYGTFASTHEILGVLQEEMHELLTAVHENASHEELIEELTDIAVGATFAIACINSKTLDW
jgi:hypothetical protein